MTLIGKEPDFSPWQPQPVGLRTVKFIRAKDPPHPVLKFLEFARARQHFIPIHYRYAFARHEEARYAFESLGTNTAPAVPALIQLTVYRRLTGTSSNEICLGQFQVIGISPAPTDVNVSLLCIIADEKIILSVRDNTTHEFLEIRRVELPPP